MPSRCSSATPFHRLWLATFCWFGFAYILPAHAAPLPIRHGNEVEACGFPSIASIHFPSGFCSATLVHPSVMVYAAHCGEGRVQVAFGDDRYHVNSTPRLSASCFANPVYQSLDDPANDWGFCLLDQPMLDIPPVGLLDACTRDELDDYTVVWQVGYGAVAGTASTPEDSGIKRWGQTILTDWYRQDAYFVTSAAPELTDPETLWTASSGCPGDSGGPALVQLQDGSWHIIGILSTMAGPSCGGDNRYSMLDNAIAAISQRTGIDLRACADLPTNPGVASSCAPVVSSPLGMAPGLGTWQTICQPTQRIERPLQCQDIWQDPQIVERLVLPAHGGCSLAAQKQTNGRSWLVVALAGLIFAPHRRRSLQKLAKQLRCSRC